MIKFTNYLIKNIFMNINEYLRNKKKFVEKLGDLCSK